MYFKIGSPGADFNTYYISYTTCECYLALPYEVKVVKHLCCLPHYCVCETQLAQEPTVDMTSTKRPLKMRSLSDGDDEMMNSDKRHHLSSSPEKQQQQPASATTSTSSGIATPQTNTPVKDEGEGEEVEDLDDRTFLNMSQEVMNGRGDGDGGASGGGHPSSYSDAAKKQPKNMYPYALYIQKGKERREPITRAHFKSFEEKLFNARMQLSFEENQKIFIDWIAYRDGHGVVTTMDQHSAAFVKSLAADFLFQENGKENVHTRGWAWWERADAWIIQGFLHGQLWRDPKKKPKHLLAQVLKMNGISGEFDLISWDTKNNIHGVFVSFEPKGDLISKLCNKSKLMAPQCTFVLQKRLRKKRTEAEFMAIQEQQQSKKASPASLKKTA